MASTSAAKVEDVPASPVASSHHGHGHHHDHFAQNKSHYNAEKAAEYRISKAGAFLAGHCADALLQTGVLNEDSTVLDFACGPGLVSWNLAKHVKSIVGADTSAAMVDQFNDVAKEKGFDSARFHAVLVGDITSSPTDLADQPFDAIICCQAFHHFADVGAMTTALMSRLKPGGRLLVIDLKKDESTQKLLHGSHKHDHIVAHKGGFRAEEIQALFEGSGLQDVSVKSAFSCSLVKFKEIACTEEWPPYTMEQAQEADARGDRFEVLLAVGTRS